MRRIATGQLQLLRRAPNVARACTSRRRFSTAPTSSINPDEIAHFSRLSSQWWDEQGEFGLLHKMNPLRMQFIRDKLLEVARDASNDCVDLEPLEGKDVLDVGCGGGLLSEV